MEALPRWTDLPPSERARLIERCRALNELSLVHLPTSDLLLLVQWLFLRRGYNVTFLGSESGVAHFVFQRNRFQEYVCLYPQPGLLPTHVLARFEATLQRAPVIRAHLYGLGEFPARAADLERTSALPLWLLSGNGLAGELMSAHKAEKTKTSRVSKTREV